MVNRIYFWATVLALTLTACSQIIPFAVNTVTSVPDAPSETQTPAFVVELSTITPSPSATSSPYPTLISSEAQELIDKIIASDEICSFPCWAGIIPGKTHWSEIHSFLESFAKVRKHSPSQPRGYTIFVPAPNTPPDNEAWFATIYLDNNNVFKYVEGNRKRISIDQLFNRYGKPDEINLFILGVLPSDNVDEFRFVFSYKKQGFLMLYEGETANKHLLDICPLGITDDPGFWIWNPDDADAFVTITEDKAYSSFWDYWSQYQKIATATKGEVTADSFYETYSNSANANVCFQIPSPSIP
jgi:hypothetical protein